MPNERRDDMDQLGRFWDDVVRGESTASDDLDPTLVEALRRFQTLGSTPPPASARERVWQDLMVQNELAQHPQETTMDASILRELPLATAPNGRTIPSDQRASTLLWRRTRRLWPLLELAAATLLLFTLFGALFAADRGLPRFARVWHDPAPANVPVARGNEARTGELPGPGPESRPTELWRVPTGCCAPPAPTLDAGVVYVGTSTNELLAIDSATGEVRWRYVAGGEIGGSPAVVDGVIYVGDAAGNMSAVDAETGEARWRVPVVASFYGGTSLYGAAPVVVEGVISLVSGAGATPPAVVKGVVYAGGDGFGSRGPLVVHAFDAASGRELWNHNIIRNGLFAHDAETGKEVWYFPTPNSVYHSAPAVADGIVYVGGKDGHVYAVDAITGQERWRFKTGGPVYASPAVAGGTVYVASDDGNFYALDAANGTARWTAALGAKGRSSAVVVDGEVYLVAGGKLHALDTGTGTSHWELEVGDAESSPTVTGGVVYVGWGDKAAQAGALVAFGDR